MLKYSAFGADTVGVRDEKQRQISTGFALVGSEKIIVNLITLHTAMAKSPSVGNAAEPPLIEPHGLRRIAAFVLACVLSTGTVPNCRAADGTLDDLENGGFDPGRTSSETSGERESSDCNGDVVCENEVGILDWMFDDLIDDTLDHLFAVGGRTSDRRVRKAPGHDGLSRRNAGEILIPFARLGLDYDQPENDISHTGVRLELGHGAQGLEFRYHGYRESRPSDTLSIFQLQYMYRMSFGSWTGLNLGVGVFHMKGESERTGAMQSLPVLLRLTRDFAAEGRKTWMSTRSRNWQESEVAILYSPRTELALRRFVLHLGYRKFSTQDAALKGPWIGVDYII